MPRTHTSRSRPKTGSLELAIQDELRASIDVKLRLVVDFSPSIERAVFMWYDTLAKGKKILFCGNGGSAADCQHIATELVVRLAQSRPALPALALTTDTSTLTAAANDFGFDAMFARQVEAHGRKGDLLVAISTSGRSRNVLAAAQAAAGRGMRTLALTGARPNPLARRADFALAVPSRDTQRIQEAHITLLHILCTQTERLLFP
jgi:D-sedoheptulose 7-phosphate isomerase